MHLAVIGAAGRTGVQVVTQGLERGHAVTAVARRPDEIGLRHADLTAVAADVREPGAVDEALRGADAVISVLGTGRSRAATTLYSDGAAHLLQAMHRHDVAQIAVVSAAPAGPREEQPWLERHVAMPLLDRFFGEIYCDMRRMETLMADSGVQWSALRPPRLTGARSRGHYRIGPSPLPRARTLTYADLAAALLDRVSSPGEPGGAVYVAN